MYALRLSKVPFILLDRQTLMVSSMKNAHDESSSLVFEITLGISRNLETPRRMTLLLEPSICNSYKYIDLLNLN